MILVIFPILETAILIIGEIAIKQTIILIIIIIGEIIIIIKIIKTKINNNLNNNNNKVKIYQIYENITK